MYLRMIAILSLLTLFGVACSAFRREAPLEPSGRTESQESFVGEETRLRASYYGKEDGFSGKRTASGEIFDPNALTAAHRSHPFGTKLRVTNPENGKSVIVRVNDRGPFTKKQSRDIDLSYRAAREIGMADEGISTVIVSVLDGSVAGSETNEKK